MKQQAAEVFRYVINGLFATAVHYIVLTVNLGLFEFKSAGLANFIAAIFGIASSFLGSRYYVFHRTVEGLLQQAMKFSTVWSNSGPAWPDPLSLDRLAWLGLSDWISLRNSHSSLA